MVEEVSTPQSYPKGETFAPRAVSPGQRIHNLISSMILCDSMEEQLCDENEGAMRPTEKKTRSPATAAGEHRAEPQRPPVDAMGEESPLLPDLRLASRGSVLNRDRRRARPHPFLFGFHACGADSILEPLDDGSVNEHSRNRIKAGRRDVHQPSGLTGLVQAWWPSAV